MSTRLALCFLARSNSLHCCVLLAPCCLRGRRVRLLLAWPGNQGAVVFVALCLQLVGLDDCDAMALIGQRMVLSTALPRYKNLPHTCCMKCLALSSNSGAFDSCVAYCFFAPCCIGVLWYGACCSLPALC